MGSTPDPNEVGNSLHSAGTKCASLKNAALTWESAGSLGERQTLTDSEASRDLEIEVADETVPTE